MADFSYDYNFIVDCLEDEHQRRAVHTTNTDGNKNEPQK